jgi:hypothetical protein
MQARIGQETAVYKNALSAASVWASYWAGS